MREAKLKATERQLLDWKRSPFGVDREKVVKLAKSLGRELFDSGKEPTFVNRKLSGLRPVTIPGHRGDLAPGTLRNIVNSLLQDVEAWREHIEEGSDDDEADEDSQ